MRILFVHKINAQNLKFKNKTYLLQSVDAFLVRLMRIRQHNTSIHQARTTFVLNFTMKF